MNVIKDLANEYYENEDYNFNIFKSKAMNILKENKSLAKEIKIIIAKCYETENIRKQLKYKESRKKLLNTNDINDANNQRKELNKNSNAIQQSKDINDSLKRSRMLMAQELQRMTQVTSILDEDTEKIKNVKKEYDVYGNSLSVSKSLLVSIQKKDQRDRFMIKLAVGFFCLVICFILWRRLKFLMTPVMWIITTVSRFFSPLEGTLVSEPIITSTTKESPSTTVKDSFNAASRPKLDTIPQGENKVVQKQQQEEDVIIDHINKESESYNNKEASFYQETKQQEETYEDSHQEDNLQEENYQDFHQEDNLQEETYQDSHQEDNLQEGNYQKENSYEEEQQQRQPYKDQANEDFNEEQTYQENNHEKETYQQEETYQEGNSYEEVEQQEHQPYEDQTNEDFNKYQNNNQKEHTNQEEL